MIVSSYVFHSLCVGLHCRLHFRAVIIYI